MQQRKPVKRKRRIDRKKQIKRLSFLFLICLLLLSVLFNFTRIRLIFKGYDFSQQSVLLSYQKERIDEYLANEELIDIENWDENKNDHNYIDYEYYSNLTHKSKEDTIHYVDSVLSVQDSLFALGYSLDSIREMMEYASVSDFETIIDKQYTYDSIHAYLDVKGCVIQDINTYMQSGLDPKKAVLDISYASIDASKPGTRNYLVHEPDNKLALVKKGFKVSDKYEPSDLVVPNIAVAPEMPEAKLRQEVSSALEQMAQDAKKEGYELMINSSYRSYEDQKKVYDEYFEEYDPITAASLVAVPGYSEHQLGFSVDLTCRSVVDEQYNVFGDTPDYRWTIENAHKYGFILRYPADKTLLTGTANEPWHYRYVGVDAAKEIYEKEWTLEEYIQNHGFSYSLSIVE